MTEGRLRSFVGPLLGLGTLLAACSGAEPRAGVHVTIDLADPTATSWATAYADHLSIIAEGSDGVRGVACLYPRSSGRGGETTAAGGDDPCADLHPSPPSLVALHSAAGAEDDWSLASRDGVNVLAPAGATVRLRAVAAWGGAALLGRSLAVAAAPVSAVADSSFPTVHLTLMPSSRAFAADCPGLDLSRAPIGALGQPVTFPSDACPRRAAGAARHGNVVATPDGGLRVPSNLSPSCGETDAVVAWKTTPFTIPASSGMGVQCGQLTLEGNFATCAPGTAAGVDCALSVQCTPPPTELVLLDAAGQVLAGTDQDLGCLPTAGGPFTIVTEFAPVTAATVSAAIEQTARGGGTGACFLDIERFAVTTVPCGN